MALTNQPYLPLYVGDWMNNNKLKLCSPAAHGIMISIMCVMHKESDYGKILLKQKFKQSSEQIKNFASQVAKLSAFDLLEVEGPLTELITERVLEIDGDYLICPRMVRDSEISQKRSVAGKSGGNSNKDKNFAYAKPQAKPKANSKAKPKANAENEIDSENVIENENKSESVNKKTAPEKFQIQLPFDTENFKSQWQLWKVYKKKQHGFNYKTDSTEQAALQDLNNLAGGNEKTAVAIIHQSMAKGWKGFFELKTKSNGNWNSNQQLSDSDLKSAVNDSVDRMFG